MNIPTILVGLACISLFVILIYVLFIRPEKCESFTLIMDEQDNQTFYVVLNILEQVGVYGMEYNDTTDVIRMVVKVPKKRKEMFLLNLKNMTSPDRLDIL